MVQLNFINRDGSVTTIDAQEGLSVMEVAVANGIDIEAACEGSCACATCHMIIPDQMEYDDLPTIDNDEEDMLDLAFGLTKTSRLTCQIRVDSSLEGITFRLPDDL